MTPQEAQEKLKGKIPATTRLVFGVPPDANGSILNSLCSSIYASFQKDNRSALFRISCGHSVHELVEGEQWSPGEFGDEYRTSILK